MSDDLIPPSPKKKGFETETEKKDRLTRELEHETEVVKDKDRDYWKKKEMEHEAASAPGEQHLRKEMPLQQKIGRAIASIQRAIPRQPARRSARHAARRVTAEPNRHLGSLLSGGIDFAGYQDPARSIRMQGVTGNMNFPRMTVGKIQTGIRKYGGLEKDSTPFDRLWRGGKNAFMGGSKYRDPFAGMNLFGHGKRKRRGKT